MFVCSAIQRLYSACPVIFCIQYMVFRWPLVSYFFLYVIFAIDYVELFVTV